MAVPARPISGNPIDSAWGQVVHDTAVALDVQTGKVTTNHAAAKVSNAVTVTFPRPFASPPVVALGCENFNYAPGLTGAAASATGFIISTNRVDQTSPTSGVVTDWIAIGPRA